MDVVCLPVSYPLKNYQHHTPHIRFREAHLWCNLCAHAVSHHIVKSMQNVKILYRIALFPILQPSPHQSLSCPHDIESVWKGIPYTIEQNKTGVKCEPINDLFLRDKWL